MNGEFAVILVDSTSHAVQIEKLLHQQKLTCKLIPVPRHLSSDCGVCVRILKLDMEQIQALIIEQKIQVQSIGAL